MRLSALLLALSAIFGISACVPESNESTIIYNAPEDSAYVEINDNIPEFADSEITTVSFEKYARLDSLLRCGPAVACVGVDLMPTEERESIGQVKPSGWQIAKYDFVDGKYLYNRCHLIGFQLSGENANERNLITGTRYFNVEGMLPFENMVADYVRETKNHVMYRVTPIFEGDNLVASGVKMEGYSVEDEGAGVCFNVYVPNIQPGVMIDYSDGDNVLDEGYFEKQEPSKDESQKPKTTNEKAEFVLNIGSKKFHLPSCKSVDTIKETNRKEYIGSRDDLILQGYNPCGACKP